MQAISEIIWNEKRRLSKTAKQQANSFDALNQQITIEEIKESIKYLKTKKAPGLL